MINDIQREFISLGIIVPIASLVCLYYRGRTFYLSERYSTFGPRFWTGYVDSCVLWPVGFITAVLSCLGIPRILTAGLAIMHTVVWLVYTVVMHARYGQTVGKMVTKVRVVDFRTEGSISWRQALLREGIPMVLSLGFLVWMVLFIIRDELNPNDISTHEALTESRAFWFLAALPGLWFIAEVLTMLTNKKRRALHDFIAGTVVVRTNIEVPQRGQYTYNVNPDDQSTTTPNGYS